MDLIILAGGLGTRLRSLIRDKPKPMALVNGKPFLEYVINYWISNGVTRIIISIGYKGKVVKDYFTESFNSIPIIYADEKKPLGTGGALIYSSKFWLLDKNFEE